MSVNGSRCGSGASHAACESAGERVGMQHGDQDAGTDTSEREPLLRPQETGRLLTAVDDDVESFDLMLLRATVFVEDACSLRSITHRQDRHGLKLRRKYYARWVQASLLLVTLINTTLVFYENPQAYFSRSTLHNRDIAPTVVEVVSLLTISADAYIRYRMTGPEFYKTKPLEWAYAGAAALGLIGCVLNMALPNAPAWHRLLRPVYLSVRWPDMTLIAATLVKGLLDVVPHIVLLAILNAAAALMAMIIFPSDRNFATFFKAFETLLIFASGSNSPDVIVSSLSHTSVAALFFAALSILSTVLILGIILATIYNRSLHHINKASRGRLARRRTAFRLAFVCLDRVSRNVANGLIDRETMALLLKRVWHVDDRMIGLLLTLLDKNGHGTINVQEFTYLFELMLLKVERMRERQTWAQLHLPLLHRACDRGWVATASDALLIVNMIVLAVDLSDAPPGRAGVCAPYCEFYLACGVAYLAENVVTATVLGWLRTLMSPIAVIDMLLVLAIVAGQVDALSGSSELIPLPVARALLICRILRIGRLFARIRLFRLIFTSVGRVLSHLPGLLGVVLASYYVFALLGIALFKGRLGYNPALANTTYAQGHMQAFNFDTFGQACVSLWAMQLQLEIQDLLDACVKVTSPWIALYFMAWLLVSYLLILNVFFAFLIDAVDNLISRPRRKEFFRVTAAGVHRISEHDLYSEADGPTGQHYGGGGGDGDRRAHSGPSGHARDHMLLRQTSVDDERGGPVAGMYQAREQRERCVEDEVQEFAIQHEADALGQSISPSPSPPPPHRPAAVRRRSVHTSQSPQQQLRRQRSSAVYGVEFQPGFDDIVGAGQTSTPPQGGADADGGYGEVQQELDLQAVAQLFGWRVSEGHSLCTEERMPSEDGSGTGDSTSVARVLQEL